MMMTTTTARRRQRIPSPTPLFGGRRDGRSVVGVVLPASRTLATDRLCGLAASAVPSHQTNNTRSIDDMNNNRSLWVLDSLSSSSSSNGGGNNNQRRPKKKTTKPKHHRTTLEGAEDAHDHASLAPPLPIYSGNVEEGEEEDNTKNITVQSTFQADLYNHPAAHFGADPNKSMDVAIVHEIDSTTITATKVMPDGKNSSAAACEASMVSYMSTFKRYIDASMLPEAQSVLDSLESMAETDDSVGSVHPETGHVITISPYAPSDHTYTLMAHAWVDDYRNDYAGTSAEKAVTVLRKMQNASIHGQLASSRYNATGTECSSSIVKVWSIVVEGWCRRVGIAPQAILQAERLLDEMENREQKLVQPNVLTYTSFLGGLARSKQADLATKAEAVLVRMKRHNVQPDSVAMTSVIHCWANAVSRRERTIAGARAVRLLNEMEHKYISLKQYSVKPSLITYTAAVTAVGNSLDPAAPELAEQILQRMYKLQESGAIANLRPTTAVYNAVIYALSRASSPVRNIRRKCAQRAEEILSDMYTRSSVDKNVQPDVRTWAAVLRAWSRCKQHDAAENAQRVLDKMEDLYNAKKALSSSIRPNFVCYTTVRNSILSKFP
jgi:Pentatricopeptide repeat domain